MRAFLLTIALMLPCFLSLGQTLDQRALEVLDLSIPQEYRIGGITVVGAEYTDVQAIKLFSALQIGASVTIPGEMLGDAIKSLWNQDLFADISIEAAELRDRDLYLVIRVKELPRLTRYSIAGVNRSEQETVRGKIDFTTGRIVNENVLAVATKRIKDHYRDKGFLDIDVDIVQEVDSTFSNGTIVRVNIDKGTKIKVDLITLNGIHAFDTDKVKRKMKSTKEKKWWRFYKSSKYIAEDFETDQQAIIALYNNEGYRNARITRDSIYRTDEGLVALTLDIEEGNKFRFGNISFTGNTKYRSTQLDSILGIRKGDIYSLAHLETRVFMDPKGMDLSSLYQDDGYLTFRAMPIEQRVENDTIDIEVRMMEGQQFRIGKILVEGNTKTNDHVIYREIRTRPGDLFSRTDIIRTQRELSQLNYFNPEAFGINPIQHPETGTVDIEYKVEEKPSDQIELSGGWGGGRVVGSLGLTFTNFSSKKMFDRDSWRPIPTGDGQSVSIRAQSNGLFFQSYNMSFIESWLGGKEPTSLSVALSKSVQSNGQPKRIDGEINELRNSLEIIGVKVGLGKRLKKPDDWFLFRSSLSYQNFNLDNYGSFFSFSNGRANNLAANISLGRNSISDPIYPTWGSNVEVSVTATIPYSMFRQEGYYEGLSLEEQYKWVEYHKWKFKAEWYTPLSRSGGENPRTLVLKVAAGVGLIGQYDRAVPLSPFERFYLGGVFLSGYTLDGREIINLRGYDDLALTSPSPQTGAPVVAKYSAELRYPLSTNPSATIFTLAFLEGGQTWEDARAFNPFQVYRSAGVGLRIFLPMFGLLGLDYGWRLDDVEAVPTMSRGQFHFSMGMNMGEL